MEDAYATTRTTRSRSGCASSCSSGHGTHVTAAVSVCPALLPAPCSPHTAHPSPYTHIRRQSMTKRKLTSASSSTPQPRRTVDAARCCTQTSAGGHTRSCGSVQLTVMLTLLLSSSLILSPMSFHDSLLTHTPLPHLKPSFVHRCLLP